MVSPTSWVRRCSCAPAAVKGELEKLAYLRQLDADALDLSVLPAERRRFLAGVGSCSTAQALHRRDLERRNPILLTLIAQSAIDVLDEVLLLDASKPYRRQFAPDVLAAGRFAGGVGTDELLRAVSILAEAVSILAELVNSAPVLERLLERDPGALILAVENDQILGSLIEGWGGWRCHLYRFAVHPDRRRQGIGGSLLAAAEERFAGFGSPSSGNDRSRQTRAAAGLGAATAAAIRSS